MNEYYDLLFGIVERFGGIVTDTAGDSMVAIWQRRDASAAADASMAALEIQRALLEFNRAHADTALVTGIGIEAGEMLMTNVGSGSRFNYRAVGDPVNTAARLQGLCRHLGCGIVVSKAALAPEMHARALGRFRLAGKRRAVVLYEPSDAPIEASLVATFGVFETALADFEAGRWELAASGFERFLESHPADGPARFLLGLARDHANRGTPLDWDGSIVWQQK
jgi:adenylate cyclase